MLFSTPPSSTISIDFLAPQNLTTTTTAFSSCRINLNNISDDEVKALKAEGSICPAPVGHMSYMLSLRKLRMDTTTEQPVPPPIFPEDYRIFATLLHGLIFVLGFCGNVLVVVVVFRTKSMHIPTYCYLVSLALADLLVVCAAMPEAIVSYQLYAGQWIFGPVGCSMMIFLNFLSINASSLSILAFTVERYIAICQPLRAKSICTLRRAKKIIIALWMFAIISSSPWLALTVVVPHYRYPQLDICTFRINRNQYAYIFASDFLIFYVIPLITASVLYFKIGLALRKRNHPEQSSFRSTAGGGCTPVPLTTPRASVLWNTQPDGSNAYSVVTLGESIRSTPAGSLRQSRIKVVRMLLVIVILFAILWLPYRSILLYNTFQKKPMLNKWLLLFAKTCVFLNSSINPILYNAMSKRFREAFHTTLLCARNHTKPFTNGTNARTRLMCSTPSPSLQCTENGRSNSLGLHVNYLSTDKTMLVPLVVNGGSRNNSLQLLGADNPPGAIIDSSSPTASVKRHSN